MKRLRTTIAGKIEASKKKWMAQRLSLLKSYYEAAPQQDEEEL